MEGPEVPTEHLHEHLHHHAGHAAPAERWLSGVALSSAIVAALAALAALLAGAHANLAMIHQMQAADQWNFFQAKGVKASVLASKMEMLEVMGKTPDPKDTAKIQEYKKEQEAIQAEAREKTHSSEEHLENHEALARAVTLFQVSIAVGAISALTRRRRYWLVSMVAAGIGAVVLSGGLRTHFRLETAEHHAKQAAEAREKAHHEGGAQPPQGHDAANHK